MQQSAWGWRWIKGRMTMAKVRVMILYQTFKLTNCYQLEITLIHSWGDSC